MRTTLLRLEGPLQSWGTQGRFAIRDTDTEPSKSGVIGLVGCALGMARDDDALVKRLADMSMVVRVDREGSLLRDYHTAGGGLFRGSPHAVHGATTAVTHRYYLCDASFLVGLGSEDPELVERIATALQSPCWPLFLGRRSCVPSVPTFAGVVDLAPLEAVKRAPYVASPEIAIPPRLRLVVEAQAGSPRNDVPHSFRLYARRHGRRHVAIEWLNTENLRGAVQ